MKVKEIKCPSCKKSNGVHKSGSYVRKSDNKRIQRYRCDNCDMQFHTENGVLKINKTKRAKPVAKRSSKMSWLGFFLGMGTMGVLSCSICFMLFKEQLIYL